MTYLIEIEVEHDSGKSPKKSIDLSSKLQEIGIDSSQIEETYTASYAPNTTNDPKDGINQQYSQANTNKEIGYQIFIEPKGEGFKEKDAWKEEFLLELRKKFKIEGLDKYYENKDFIIIGLPFYNQNDPNVFGDKMEQELKIKK